ncbi:MAG TPA: HAD-IA family hydrolase [Coriobacteriia bacterium]|nr:HAD-IA family hydrolase [Coriobacteriia bacterium]
MIRALVFDFDGLIMDSEVAVAGSYADMFAAEGFDFPVELWRTMVGTRENDDVLWRELERLTGKEFPLDTYEQPRRERSFEIADELPVLPGVQPLIEDAHERGLGLAIASSSSEWWVSRHLSRLGLAEYFSAVVTKEATARSKPDPSLYLEAMRRLGVSGAEAIALEDSGPGLTAAVRAGMHTVAVPGSYTEGMDFSAADVCLSSLAETTLDKLLESFGRE